MFIDKDKNKVLLIRVTYIQQWYNDKLLHIN
jgi:hypothetical protein